VAKAALKTAFQLVSSTARTAVMSAAMAVVRAGVQTRVWAEVRAATSSAAA
jgi:hypothetical protein